MSAAQQKSPGLLPDAFPLDYRHIAERRVAATIRPTGDALSTVDWFLSGVNARYLSAWAYRRVSLRSVLRQPGRCAALAITPFQTTHRRCRFRGGQAILPASSCRMSVSFHLHTSRLLLHS